MTAAKGHGPALLTAAILLLLMPALLVLLQLSQLLHRQSLETNTRLVFNRLNVHCVNNIHGADLVKEALDAPHAILVGWQLLLRATGTTTWLIGGLSRPQQPLVITWFLLLPPHDCRSS